MTDRAPSKSSRANSERTRAALIEAGLKLFGDKGFAATSTREIAAAADANIASIAYHFGGKEGLRDACAQHIVATVQALAQPVLTTTPVPEDEKAAEAQLRAIVQRMAGFLLAASAAGPIVQFILRELQHPTQALDIIYNGVFEPVHRRLCQVWAAATGEAPEDDETKLVVFTMIGQLVYFRIGREAVTRRMGWSRIGPEEAARIASVAVDNLLAVIAAHRSRKP